MKLLYSSRRLAAVVLFGTALAATPVVAQTFAQTYAKSGKGGLLLNGEAIKQGNSHSMSGYKIQFQNDGNLCLKTDADAHRWCMNDEIGTRYQQTKKVAFEKGTLIAYDGAGKKLWSTRQVADPYAKLIITPEGKLQTISAVGVVYWQNK